MFKGLVKNIREVFFPSDYTCDICGIETFGTNLCADCLKKVTFNNGATCPVCGRKTVRPEICLECKAQAPKFKQAVSPLVYEDGGIILIGKFKNGNGYLKEYFADLIEKKLIGFPEIDCVVSVPCTKKSKRKRGYDQTELLAKALSERVETPYIKGAIVKIKDTPVQKGLTQKERKENVNGAYKAAKPNELKDKSVLVVDDVLTTGATADEMCKVILKAGASRVYLATAASVEYKAIKDET